MQPDTFPRAAGVTGAVMAGDIIEPLIKPGSGIPTTPRPPSYDQPAPDLPQSDPGDEDGFPAATPSTPETDADPRNPNVRPEPSATKATD